MRGIIKARINAPEMKDISEFTLVIATRVVAVIPNNDDCFSCQSLLYASLEELAEWTHEDGHEIYDPISKRFCNGWFVNELEGILE